MEQTELACKIMQLAIDNNTNKVDKANAIVKATELIEIYRKEQLSIHGVVKSFVCNNCQSKEEKKLTTSTSQCLKCGNLQAN